MPRISSQNIAIAIYEAIEGKAGSVLSATLRQSVLLLERKRMLSKSEEILRALQNILDKKTGTVRMKVTTAKKIGHDERKKIEHQVRERYKAKEIVSDFFEKEELLGGMRVEVGDEVTDTSYKSRSEELEIFLKQEK